MIIGARYLVPPGRSDPPRPIWKRPAWWRPAICRTNTIQIPPINLVRLPETFANTALLPNSGGANAGARNRPGGRRDRNMDQRMSNLVQQTSRVFRDTAESI